MQFRMERSSIFGGQYMESEIRAAAEYVLNQGGLLKELKKYGEPHVIGSYAMDLMVARDLDIDIENSNMSLKKLHELTAFILERFSPVWYEAKEEETEEGKTVWFHGFEAYIGGECWNFDLWFFDAVTIERAEAYCSAIAAQTRQDPEAREAILRIKAGLMERNLYSFERYRSVDVYESVLKKGVRDVESFLRENEQQI